MIPVFTLKEEKRARKGFQASDFGKLSFDIFHAFKGTEPTNPPEWNDTLKWGAGKGVELAMVQVLKDSNIVSLKWDQEKEETHEMEREGVKVRMKIDAIVEPSDLSVEGLTPIYGLEVGAPIEIKSINNKNAYDIKAYAEGKPRENYVGQLAVYMDYLGKEIGYLFVASVDGLSYFWLTCRKTAEGLYECGNTKVNITDEYKRWALIQRALADNHEPSVFEKYKIPLKDIDWKTVSKTDIAKARAGAKVIGDKESWKITYSPYKDLILKAQGVEPGYTDEELSIIKTATAGYTSKNAKI